MSGNYKRGCPTPAKNGDPLRSHAGNKEGFKSATKTIAFLGLNEQNAERKMAIKRNTQGEEEKKAGTWKGQIMRDWGT